MLAIVLTVVKHFKDCSRTQASHSHMLNNWWYVRNNMLLQISEQHSDGEWPCSTFHWFQSF